MEDFFNLPESFDLTRIRCAMSRLFCFSYLSWLLDFKQSRFRFSVSKGVYPLPGDSFDELRI